MFDLTPIYRSTIGFDRLARTLNEASAFDAPTYPPYNIEKLSDDEYRITMAVAGFAPEDITVEVKGNALSVAAKKTEKQEQSGEFLHQGIASRAFERRFQLADHVQVLSAGMENGLLHVALKREVPEALKPRTIPVNGKFTPRQRDVYDAVLHVKREATRMLRPGTKYYDYHREVQKIMESVLIGLNLIDKHDVKHQDKSKPLFQKYFMHGTGHQLGLDVHDVGNMYHKMRAGQVWTVEPGIYIREEGFGIRIENNVVIGDDEVFDLMRNIPEEADEIESIMQS